MNTLGSSVRRVQLGPSMIQAPRVEDNAWKIARFGDEALPTAPPDDWQAIRRGYLTGLNRIQNHRFPEAMIGADLRLEFGDNPGAEAALKELLDADPLPEGWKIEDRAEREQIERNVAAAAEVIAALDPDLFRNMRIVVAGFIFARRPDLEGGSTSALMGPIWLDPKQEWVVDTYVEHMVHEFVHQALFLDEMIRTVFSRFTVIEMSVPEALVTSTILKRRRPYDKAFHSAFVAHALAQLYIAQGNDGKAREYLESTRGTTDELLDRSDFVTANGLALLREMSDEVDEYLQRVR